MTQSPVDLSPFGAGPVAAGARKAEKPLNA